MCPCLLLYISWMLGFDFANTVNEIEFSPQRLKVAVLGNSHMIAAAEGKGKTKDDHIVPVAAIGFEFTWN